jgi:hypothetical protein
MDTKSILNARKKMNELAIQHNKLTTLVACCLSEINFLKKELSQLKGGNVESSSNNVNSSSSSNNRSQDSISNQNMSRNSSQSRLPNFNDLRAEDILKQLSINNVDN